MLLYLFLFLLCFKFVRMVLFNIFNVVKYTTLDIYNYIKFKKWKIWNGFGIHCYMGLFGAGKSLSASQYVCSMARRYNLNVLSNIKLYGLDYTHLSNFKQIIDAPENTIILIDECSTIFNSRNWKDFPIELLFQMLQCRKNKKQLILTAQRFPHVDKLIRDVTHYAIDCKKYWRFQHVSYYDAWDYENAMNRQLLKKLFHKWYFVTDKLYDQYDTDEIVDYCKSTEFVSNADIRDNRGTVDTSVINVENKSRKLKKMIKKNGVSV